MYNNFHFYIYSISSMYNNAVRTNFMISDAIISSIIFIYSNVKKPKSVLSIVMILCRGGQMINS